MKTWTSIYDFTPFSVLSEVQGHVSSETSVWTPPSDDNNNNYPVINVGAVILLPLLVAVGAAGKRYSGIWMGKSENTHTHTHTLLSEVFMMTIFTFTVRACSSLVTGCKRIILLSQIVSVNTDLVKKNSLIDSFPNDSHDSINDWFSSYGLTAVNSSMTGNIISE